MAIPSNLADLSNAVEQLDADSLVLKFQQMASDGTHKIKLNTRDRTNSLIIRINPEIQNEWATEANTLSKAQVDKSTKTSILKKFRAAFKDGKVIIEVKKDRKRIAYGSKKAIEQIQKGGWTLKDKQGNIQKYENFEVLDSDAFLQLSQLILAPVGQADTQEAASEEAEVVENVQQQAVDDIQDQETKKLATASKKGQAAPQPPPLKEKARTSTEVEEDIRKEEQAKEAEKVSKKREEKRQELNEIAQEERLETAKDETEEADMKQIETTEESVKADTKELEATNDKAAETESVS